MAIKGRIGLVGGGNMGSALVKGLLAAGLAGADQVVVAEQDQARRAALAAETGVAVVASAGELVNLAVLILAVKPPTSRPAPARRPARWSPAPWSSPWPPGCPWPRWPGPLTPTSPWCGPCPTPRRSSAGGDRPGPGAGVGQADLALATDIFGAVGQVVVVTEKALDAVTGLSGSGPAYVFLFIEALADAGVAQGLDRATALTLAQQTVAGAARLAIESGEHPATLKDRVTSPGGTTISGLHVLERGGLRGLVMDAVAAATDRSRELGKS